MSQASGHLSEAQVKACITGSAMDPDAQKQLDAHLVDCESCLNRLLDAERIHLGLLEGDGMTRTPYPGCPAEETLQELAAGICAPDTAETATEHAAHCNYCGPLLSQYLREFSDDVQEEDAALLQELKTSSPKWQKNFIRENLPKPVPAPWFRGWWPKLATAAAVVAGLFFYLRPSDLEKAQGLVAAAYAEHRTTEMRLIDVPHAEYSPVPIERSGEANTSLDYQRPSLLRAEAAVGDKLKSESHVDPRWLQVKARLDLLQGTPASAADAQGVLEKARAEGLSSPSLEIDLAASSFEHATREDSSDLSVTINLLRAALEDPKISKQDQLVALFDLGVAYQKSKIYNLAIETWDRYLQLDSSSAWANEARDWLDKAKKATAPKSQSFLDTQTPLFFLNHSDDPAVLEELDVYQDRALRFWVPKAVQEPNGLFSEATHRLADLLEQHDSDPWMKEFLGSPGNNDVEGVQALSRAIRDNKAGLYVLAVQESKIAARIFTEHGNLPGSLRARFESIYASQRFLEGFDCLTQIASVQIPERYRWLAIQLSLEKYTCSNFGGEFATIERGLESSREEAEAAHYYSLTLRSIALAAGITRQRQAGCREVWQKVAQGLDLYWLRAADRPEPLYEFYSILEQCAAQTRLWHTAEALQRSSMVLAKEANRQDNDPNLILEGSAHAELAAVLAAQAKDVEADAEQVAADAQWQAVRNERTADTYRLFMRVRLAEIQLDRGDAQRALATLESARGLLASTQYQLLSLDFYRLLGKTSWRLHRLPDAASAYEYGINIAENSLRGSHLSAKSRLQWVTKADDVYRGMVRVWLEQGRSGDAWKLWEWYRTRSLFRQDETASQPDTTGDSPGRVEAETAKVSLPSEHHLVYASFEDGLEAWTVDATGIRSRWLPIPQSELVSLINDFAQECADQASRLDEVHRQAQKLYSLLIKPMVADLNEASIVIAELDRPLSRLVLPALMSSDGKYFAVNHAVVYSPGVLMEKSLRVPIPIEASDRLLLLDASESHGSGSVPGHLEEREAASHAYSHVKLLSGNQTTASEIKRELSRSSVFDFIGHGEQHGSRTELRVSTNVSLSSEDFTPSALAHIKLGILAACSTGAGGDDRLLDTDNLVHSFLFAGVPDVIASQWNVDSAATSQLMETFHAHLGAGEPIIQAMYQAQKAMLMARDHPYFWAGFNLSGRAN